jgi:AbrB family transcriptional regulator, transcriptional pleiotropic regulator of transition state genes
MHNWSANVTTTSGITRRIDHLGRIVVPAGLRRSLGIRDGDAVEISERDGQLVLRKIEPQCAICGSPDDLIDLREKQLCARCIDEIRLEGALERSLR